MTAALARVCARHPWRTIAGWLIAAVVGILLAGSFLGGRLSSQGQVTSRPASIRANDLLDQRFPAQTASFELVVVRSPTETVDSQAFRAEVSRLENAGRASKVVSGASVYYANHDPALVSSDRHALLIPITLTQKGVDDNASPLVDAVKRFDGKNGFSVTITGEQTTNYDFNHLSQHDLESGELQIGLPAAILVLLVVFGAVVAASLPLILAIISIAVALGLTTLLALEFNLSIFLVNMLTGMGLALGIDYALFVSSRFREERAHGKERAEAIASAGATASKAVLFSGTSFVLAMLGLLMVQSTIMRSLAVGAILVGVVAVAAALTLLPAILSLLGDRINRLRIPIVGKRAAEQAGQESPFWDAIVHRVMRRPLISFVAVAALLLAAASPLFGMNIGASGISTLPNSAIEEGLRGGQPLLPPGERRAGPGRDRRTSVVSPGQGWDRKAQSRARAGPRLRQGAAPRQPRGEPRRAERVPDVRSSRRSGDRGRQAPSVDVRPAVRCRNRGPGARHGQHGREH